MTKIILKDFRGQFPYKAPRDLPEEAAQTAINCDLGSGQLRPLASYLRSHTPTKAGTQLTIYRWGASLGVDDNGTISAVQNTTPIQIDCSANHGRTTGDRVFIAGTGIAAADNLTHTITVVDANSFTLNSTTAGGTSATGTWVFENGYWFTWTADVDVARGPIAGDTTDVVYWTGETEPRMSYSPIAVTGGTDYPMNWYILGIPAPATALTATPGTGGGCDTSEQNTRVYVYTYMSARGEEGPPSPASTSVDVCPGQTVDLSAMAVAPAGNYNITQKRIYRSDSNGEYVLVGTVAVATTTYADTETDPSVYLESTLYDAPPTGMKYLTMHPNGFAVGAAGNELCLSVPNLIHAWPGDYRQPTNTDIIAIGIFGTTIVVADEEQMYFTQGVDPSALVIEKAGGEYTCVAPNSLRGLGDMGVVFASSVGLVSLSQSGERVITMNHIDQATWQALKPESIHGYVVDYKYVGFYNNGTTQGGFIFDPQRPDYGVRYLNFYADCGYVDPLTDRLYLMISGNIEEFNGSSSLLSYDWKSKIFRTSTLTNFGWCQVIANSYSGSTIYVYADGVLKHSQAISTENFRLPGGFLAKEWEIRITGTDRIDQVVLATDARELE